MFVKMLKFCLILMILELYLRYLPKLLWSVVATRRDFIGFVSEYWYKNHRYHGFWMIRLQMWLTISGEQLNWIDFISPQNLLGEWDNGRRVNEEKFGKLTFVKLNLRPLPQKYILKVLLWQYNKKLILYYLGIDTI